MSKKFTEYFNQPQTRFDYGQFAIAVLIRRYDERGEVMPRYTFNQGKLQTDCSELRLHYRQLIDGAGMFAMFLDAVQANKQAQQQAQQANQQNQNA